MSFHRGFLAATAAAAVVLGAAPAAAAQAAPLPSRLPASPPALTAWSPFLPASAPFLPASAPFLPASLPDLPALSPVKLRAALAGLPDAEASGALVQVRGSAGSWTGSAGVGNQRTGAGVAPDGRFRIGSMTKVFTAVVALQLVAERRLALDRTVQSYLPGFLPASYAPITVRQVLTYTSGLNGVGVPHKAPEWFFTHRYDHWADGSQLDLTKPLAFTPGTRQRYGNQDYWMAGLLIQRVTGHTWEREVRDRIIRPLGLHGTSVPADDPHIPGRYAHGYEATADGWRDVSRANPSLQWSAAAIISTAPDLDKLLVALFRGRLVPPRQLELMFTVPPVLAYGTDQPASYGMGLGRFQVGDLTLWGKSGDRPGYSNGMGATRDLSRRLVFSVNTLHMGGAQPVRSQQIIAAAFS